MVSPTLKQLFIGLSPMWQQFHTSLVFALLPTILTSLRLPDSQIQLTVGQESWIEKDTGTDRPPFKKKSRDTKSQINELLTALTSSQENQENASVTSLMTFPTNTIAGLLTTLFGRKYVYITYLSFNFISAMLVYFSKDFFTLLLAYIFLGLTGGCEPLGTFLLAESVSPKIRGIILDVKYGCNFLGLVAPRFITPYCSWRMLALYSAVPVVVCMLVSSVGPESPPWLASKGRFDECKVAFLWLRGENELDELNELIVCQKSAVRIKRTDVYKRQGHLTKTFNFLLDKSFLKAGFICVTCVLFYDFSAKIIILTYADILNAVTNDAGNYEFYIQLLGLSDILALCVSFIAVTRLRRRTLLFGAGVPAAVFLFLFCILTFFNIVRLPWLRFTLVCLFFFFVTAGPMAILNAIQGEVFPLSHRGLGTALTSFVFVIVTFAILKTAPFWLEHLTIQGMFFINAAVLSICLLILYCYLPETFNRTLQDIENELKGNVLSYVDGQMSDSKLLVECKHKTRSIVSSKHAEMICAAYSGTVANSTTS